MSRILKPADDGLRVPGVQVFDLRPVEERARAIVEAAQAELGRARREAERIREAARTEGFELGRHEGLEAGRREGLEHGLAQARELLATLTAVASDLQGRRADLITNAQRHLLQLAVAIARRIVQAHLAFDPEVVGRNVAAALALVAESDRVLVAVHPTHAERVRQILSATGPDPQRAGPEPQDARLAVVPDEAVPPGGCIVRTAGGLVDATLETQLEEIERQLLNPGAAGGEPQATSRDAPGADPGSFPELPESLNRRKTSEVKEDFGSHLNASREPRAEPPEPGDEA